MVAAEVLQQRLNLGRLRGQAASLDSKAPLRMGCVSAPSLHLRPGLLVGPQRHLPHNSEVALLSCQTNTCPGWCPAASWQGNGWCKHLKLGACHAAGSRLKGLQECA